MYEAPRKAGARKADHVLHHRAPEQSRDAEQQRDPEPISEHGHAMPFMPVMRARLTVTGVTRRPGRPLGVAGPLGSVGHPVMVLVRSVFGLRRVHSWAPSIWKNARNDSAEDVSALNRRRTV
jgi:hypothetical protein